MPDPCPPHELPLPAGVEPSPKPTPVAATKAAGPLSGKPAVSTFSSSNSLADRVTALDFGAQAAVATIGGGEPMNKKPRM